MNSNRSAKTLRKTPFVKILVANRGEIALRIMRTARRLGHGVVAVYSDADRDALHVRRADQAVRIGEALPSQSYLKSDAIIAAAKASGADAVHPGYGFLAENERFAQTCVDAGLVFIGPSPQAIKAMGNKAGAKTLMQAAGVPCVPGYQGEDQSEAAMLREAERLTTGDTQLQLDQIESGDRLGHGMLDLQAGVHFHEIELAALVEQELQRAGPLVAQRADGGDRDLAHPRTQLWRDGRRRRFLDQLLVPPLHRAVALAEMDGIAVAVAEHLDLDVTGIDDRALENDGRIAERALRLRARTA